MSNFGIFKNEWALLKTFHIIKLLQPLHDFIISKMWLTRTFLTKVCVPFQLWIRTSFSSYWDVSLTEDGQISGRRCGNNSLLYSASFPLNWWMWYHISAVREKKLCSSFSMYLVMSSSYCKKKNSQHCFMHLMEMLAATQDVMWCWLYWHTYFQCCGLGAACLDCIYS